MALRSPNPPRAVESRQRLTFSILKPPIHPMKTPFQLDQALALWRAELSESGSIGSTDLAELETHLRDSFEELRKHELPDDEAFHLARRRLGGAEVAEEFAKVDSDAVWAGRARWMIFGVLVSQIFWNGTKMVTYLTMAMATMSTRGLSWSGWATAMSFCLAPVLAMSLFVWGLVRLVRGNWRMGTSRQVAFLLHPAVLACIMCLLDFMNNMAISFFISRRIAIHGDSTQDQILGYILSPLVVAVPVILAVAMTKAQRRAGQVP